MSQSMAPYAGDVSPAEAWSALESDPAAALVDVRTVVEWNFVGTPDLSGLSKRPVFQEWQTFPSMQVDTAFVDKVAGALSAAGAGPDTPVYFLCRSGARSQAAATAMAARGWSRCFNIACGFEGPLGPDRHRGASAGWKADGLPWSQS
ncbi:MAG TPA: rhodanese-like domain-containing protein [Hansschlegelia sp.]